MSTIASPRTSTTFSSPRGSISTDTTSGRPGLSASNADRGSLRRNRAALRDYYGLKAAAQGNSHETLDSAALDAQEASDTQTLESERDSELDKAGLDPHSYVQHLLSNESLEGLLRVEAGVVSDVRSLDGEKKALVYDNYSKLITATDTIRSMREKMDPMNLTTSTLGPAIGHIAETALALRADLKTKHPKDTSAKDDDLKNQRATVRWVLDSPERIRRKMNAGDTDSAELEWKDISALLDKWQGIQGTDEVRRACLDALQSEEKE